MPKCTNMKTNSITTNPLIDLRGVNLEHEKKRILSRVSLEIHKGDHWAIIGPNGSGKTTFLKLLAGTHWPASGPGERLYGFNGTTQNDSVLALKRIYLLGHELQDSFIQKDWNFTALDIVLAGIKKTDVLRDKVSVSDKLKAQSLLKEVGAFDLINRDFFELSRGQQRKVLIARILAFEPEIIILDEPLSGLDKKSRIQLNQTIERISISRTVICSYHHTGDVPDCMNKIAFIADGLLQYAGNIMPEHLKGTSLAIDSSSSYQAKSKINQPGDENNPIIDIANAAVWIEKELILKDMTWVLLKNQHWQILGPNGSGKSTFIKLLYGLFRPAKGGYLNYIGISNPKNIWSLRRQIAWVSPELQSNYWYPTNVRQCIISGLSSSIGQTKKPTSEEAKYIESLMSIFNLTDLATQNVKKLSYGQFRRVLIARALVTNPKILLLDEPWEGLDPDNLKLITRILNELIEQNDTQIICATHLDEPGVKFTHQAIFNDGIIIEQIEL